MAPAGECAAGTGEGTSAAGGAPPPAAAPQAQGEASPPAAPEAAPTAAPGGGAAAAAAAAAGLGAVAGSDGAEAAGPAVEAEAEGCEWYFQEATTRQPAGPWTVAQLRARVLRNQIDGLTPVWRLGLEGGWQPLADVEELREVLRLREGEEEDEEPLAKRRRRASLDDVPLTHTYTSEHGVLYVYDEVDEDWKASDMYEALLKEEALAEALIHGGREAGQLKASVAPARPAPAAAVQDPEQARLDEQEEALRELLADAGPPAAPPPVAALASVRAEPSAPQPLAARRSGPAAAAAGLAAGAGPAAAGGAGAAPVDEAQEAKRQKRRDYRERKKLKRQAGVFVKAQENPNVYVSGLPPDVTLQELEPVFKRAGVLKVDVDTGEAKIRIYQTPDGKSCKGDALVTYANAASVELAVKFLHEFELRPKCRLCVQQADFEEHERDPRLSTAQLKELATSRQSGQERAKYIAAKNAQKEAVSWGSEMDDGTGRRVVILKHLFSLEEAEKEGPDFYTELSEEVREECAKIGQVAKVTPLERHRLGIVCVKFKTSSEAEECIRVMDGRFFAGRTIEAAFYDGRTDLRVLGGPTALPSGGPKRPQLPQAAATKVGSREGAKAAAPSSPHAAPHGAAGAAAPTAPEAPGQPDGAPAGPAPADGPSPPPGAEAAGPQPPDGKSWAEWLEGQSDDDDEELRVRVAE